MNKVLRENLLDKYHHRVVGVVSPIAWDTMGIPTSFSIFTDYGEDILVINKNKKHELRRLTNKIVEAFGSLHEGEDGEKFINIRKIQLLGTPNSSPSPSPEEYLGEELPLSVPHLSETWLDAEDYRDFGYAV